MDQFVSVVFFHTPCGNLHPCNLYTFLRKCQECGEDLVVHGLHGRMHQILDKQLRCHHHLPVQDAPFRYSEIESGELLVDICIVGAKTQCFQHTKTAHDLETGWI